MGAKILYTKQGSDPATLTWPPSGPPYERWTFTSGTPLNVTALIGYGDGSITFADGRAFVPVPVSNQGSTLVHQKG